MRKIIITEYHPSKNKSNFLLLILFLLIFSLKSLNVSAVFISFPNQVDTKQERMNVQIVLNRVMNPSPPLEIDGILGKKSIDVLKTFQKILELVTDGKIGKLTRASLENIQLRNISTLSLDCFPGDLFSGTTGKSCTKSSPSFISGCTASTLYSPLTGLFCNNTSLPVSAPIASGSGVSTGTVVKIRNVGGGAGSKNTIQVNVDNNTGGENSTGGNNIGLVDTIKQNTEYFLSPAGNDITGTGKIDKPWFSLNTAWSVVKPGDTIYMRGGNYLYDISQNLQNKNGLPSNRINIWAYENEQPIISPSLNYTETRGINVSGDYIYMKGIEISGFVQKTSDAFYYGIASENSSSNIFEKLKVHDNGFGLSIGGDSGDNLILNSDFYNNADPSTRIDSNVPWGGADGLTIRTSDKNKINTIRGCRMWWNSDDGLDLYENEGTVVIENSWSFWNGFIPRSFELAGDGNGFKIGPTLTDQTSSLRRILKNNIAFENRTRGFDQNNLRAITHLYNNTSYNNANLGEPARSFDFWNGTAATIAKNNLSFQHSLAPLFNREAIMDNNSFLINGESNSKYEVTSNDFVNLNTAGVTGPRQTDGSLPNINFLKLSSNSDLVDAGVDVGIIYKGKSPDIGAFESGM